MTFVIVILGVHCFLEALSVGMYTQQERGGCMLVSLVMTALDGFAIYSAVTYAG